MCLFCGGILHFLGKLGKLNWFRCSGCGMDQSKEGEDND